MILQKGIEAHMPTEQILSWILWSVVIGLTIWSGHYVITAWIGGITLAYVIYSAGDEDIDDHPAGGPRPLDSFFLLAGIVWIEFIYIIIAALVLSFINA